MKKLLMMLLASVAVAACNGNSNVVGNNDKTVAQIKADLQKNIPDLPADLVINKSQANGMYEISVGRKIFYVTNDGKYLMFGNLIDIGSKRNLTAQRIEELSKIDWNKLPLDLAIKEVNGTGKHKIAVFSDPDCPYCKMFEKQVVPNLKDTTVYVFLFPLNSHPNAKSDANKIWCSKDRLASWRGLMLEGKPLPTDQSCDVSSLDTIYKIGTDVVEVEGTPTLILANGQVLPGAMPAEQLLDAMEKAEKTGKSESVETAK